MAEKRKPGTKKDLEDKIAQLEAKLSKLSTQLETKPAEATPKPEEAPKPAETKPAETTPSKPKGTLPKGFGDKPAEATPKPEEAPKPAETTAQLPVTAQEALEKAYYDAPMTDFHQYRAKVTGYSPAPNRYFVRLTAPVGKVPTTTCNFCFLIIPVCCWNGSDRSSSSNIVSVRCWRITGNFCSVLMEISHRGSHVCIL